MSRHPYATAITDAEWRSLQPHMPSPKAGGRPQRRSIRELLKAIFYSLRSGCAWRLMPHDLPPWKTVDHDVRRWRLQGRWDKLHAALQAAARLKVGRQPQPRAAIVDSPSVKTSVVGGPRGDAGGQTGTGRQRHLLVATQGLVVRAAVHPAHLAARDGARWLWAPRQGQLPRVPQVRADRAYSGKTREGIASTWGGTLEIVKPWWTGVRWGWVGPGQAPPLLPSGFHLVPRRWVVERTCAWRRMSRRLSQDDAELPATRETLSYVAMSRLMVKRLAHTRPVQTASQLDFIHSCGVAQGIRKALKECAREFHQVGFLWRC